MLVSQYIYTACGKDRNGAFSVFSKSRDITDSESSEIREVMTYKTPVGLPYEPTEVEIEEKYPKKFGYFYLSSGRVCLAQVCYVGQVYSDLDTRWGNYIIHAFIFEKTDDFAPYGFIEHTIFKRKLTMKEWRDDPIPDELQQIEIPENGGMLSMGEVTTFFNEDRKNKLKLLIEATTNLSSEDAISFNDDPLNQKYWFKILSLCLPKIIQNKISFCSHFTNTLIPGNISSRIQIRVNRPENSQFNYAQEAHKGRYAFDFLRNIIPVSVNPGKYAENVIKLLFSGIFEAVKFVDNINKIMSIYSVNINEAANLINLNRAEYSDFENADEIFNTISIADSIDYETQTIANNLWTKKPQFNFSTQQILSINAFIYKNIPATRIEIIKTIINKAEQYGIRTDGPKIFRDDLNSKANFIFANYLDYLKTEGLVNYVAQNQNSFPKLFLAFDSLTNLPKIKNSLQERNYKSSEEIITIKNIMESVFRQQSILDLEPFMNLLNLRVNNSGIELLSVIIQDSIDYIKNVKFAFDILRLVRPKSDFAYDYLLKLIRTISNQEEFIKVYINAQNNNPDFYAKFENEKKDEPVIKDFCKKRDAYRFANHPLTFEFLKEYFHKYYVNNADTGIFVKRLGEYINSLQSEKKIDECSKILNIMTLPRDTDKALLLPILRIVLEAIFSVEPYKKIYDGKQEWFDKIREIYNTVTNAGGGLKQEICELIIITLYGQDLKKYSSPENNRLPSFFDSVRKIEANSLAANFGKINSNKSIEIFIDHYFPYVANILILGASIKQSNYGEVLEKMFGKIIEKGDLEKLTDNIILGIKKSKASAIDFILYIFRKDLADSQDGFDKKLGAIARNYFGKLSSGERKKIFSELLVLAKSTEEAQFKRYFEEFNKEHKSRLSNIFNIFKREK